jgi:hypothetical protein
MILCKTTFTGLLFIFLAVFGCQNKDSHFYKVTMLPGFQDSLGSNYHLITEAYIIANPPKDTNALKKMVDDHFKYLPLPNTQYYDLERRFYKETKDTPRNYAETSSKYDSLDHHFKDEILIVNKVKDAKGEYISYNFFSNGAYQEEKRIYITLSRHSEN